MTAPNTASHAAEACAGCVKHCGVLPALFALQTLFFLPLALMFLDKGGARAEDGRKRQEQSAGGKKRIT